MSRIEPTRYVAATAAMLLLFAACSTVRVVDSENETTSNANGGQGGMVAAGGMMAAGGEGGSGSTAGAGGSGGSDGPCGVDCSLIQAPACMESVCDPSLGQCVVQALANGMLCDDGVYCTINDSCQNGACMGGPPNDCGLSHTPCEQITCDDASNSCTYIPIPDGTPCTSNNLCIVNASCSGGQCNGTVKDCFLPPPIMCQYAVCNPTTGNCNALPTPSGTPCSNGNPCIVGEVCNMGACVGGMPVPPPCP